MATTQKASVTLDAHELRWVKARAKRVRASVSSLVSEAVRVYREETTRREAQLAFVAKLSPRLRATPEEVRALEAMWRG